TNTVGVSNLSITETKRSGDVRAGRIFMAKSRSVPVTV
ncbi:MAG: hypothetical protein ACI91Z_001906, partial [Yoonia sp.]